MKRVFRFVVLVLVGISVLGLIGCGDSGQQASTEQSENQSDLKDEYRFVMIPILAQAWFDIVYEASVRAADTLGPALGTKITIDYQAAQEADIVAQNELLERAIATQPDGIAIDPIDIESQLPIIKEAQERGIPVVMYAAIAPEGELISHIGNDFYEQGMAAANAILERIDYSGKVAIIHGVPTNTPHADRFRAYEDRFGEFPDVEIVATAFDYDDIEIAQREAAAILSAHPDLDAFAVCDAAGPVGVGYALKEAGRVGEVQYVGIDDLPQLQELMREGVLDLSVATKPNNIGEWATISLMMSNLGIDPVIWYDTKYGLLTPDMVADGNIRGF
jgi:ribose transport system substrate-binding protein